VKLLIYSHSFAPGLGGVETIVMALAQGLSAASAGQRCEPMEVTVVTPTPRNGSDDSSLPFRIVRHPSPWTLLRVLRSADLIHLAGPALLPLLLALLLRKPVVVEHHGFQAICPNGQLFYEPSQSPCPGHFMAGRHGECLRCNSREGRFASFKLWLLTFLRRLLCRWVAANIAPTHWTETLLELPRALTIHHGLIAPQESGAVEAPQHSATFAFQGRLVSTKGAHLLLEAASQLKAKGIAFQVRIIGEGPERTRLESLAVSLQLNGYVHFLGALPQEVLHPELSRATAIVMPSLGGEVFGLVALENMQRGRLLIVSDLGALAEVVGGAGLVFPVGNAVELSARLEQVLAFPEGAQQLRLRARHRISEFFDGKRMIENHIHLYEKYKL